MSEGSALPTPSASSSGQPPAPVPPPRLSSHWSAAVACSLPSGHANSTAERLWAPADLPPRPAPFRFAAASGARVGGRNLALLPAGQPASGSVKPPPGRSSVASSAGASRGGAGRARLHGFGPQGVLPGSRLGGLGARWGLSGRGLASDLGLASPGRVLEEGLGCDAGASAGSLFLARSRCRQFWGTCPCFHMAANLCAGATRAWSLSGLAGESS